MDTEQKFNLFLEELNENFSDIISIYLIGSAKGIYHPHDSDIDLFIVVEDGTSINELFNLVRTLEKKYFGTEHSRITDFIQKNFLGSDDFTGIHLICVSKGNIKKSDIIINPFVNLIMSESLFIKHIQKQGKLLYGRKIEELHQPINVGIEERIVSFFPLIILLIYPFKRKDRREAIIWLSKLLKYHLDIAKSYYEVSYSKNLDYDDLKLNKEILSLITTIRYNPEKYEANTIYLFIKVSWNILKNLPFIFFKDFLIKPNNKKSI
jgi:predicted nucleotidyltransferase